MRKFPFFLLLVLIAGLVLVGLIPQPAPEPEKPEADKQVQKMIIPETAPLSMGQGIRLPTAEELEDEKRYRDKQIELAALGLDSASVAEQVGSVEQLSAFPTPESEGMLANTLLTAFNSSVRVAAAIGLLSFQQPSAKSMDALVAALADSAPEVQATATNSLQALLSRMEHDKPEFKKILADLKTQANTRQVLPQTRQAIFELLKDWGAEPKPEPKTRVKRPKGIIPASKNS